MGTKNPEKTLNAMEGWGKQPILSAPVKTGWEPWDRRGWEDRRGWDRWSRFGTLGTPAPVTGWEGWDHREHRENREAPGRYERFG
jgi:hypothetical protein